MWARSREELGGMALPGVAGGDVREANRSIFGPPRSTAGSDDGNMTAVSRHDGAEGAWAAAIVEGRVRSSS